MVRIFKLKYMSREIEINEIIFLSVLKTLYYRNKNLYNILKYKYETLIEEKISDEFIKDII